MTMYTCEVVERFHRNGFAGPFDLYTREEAQKAWNDLRIAFLDTSRAAHPTSSAQYDRHLDIEFLSRHICRPEIVGFVREAVGPNVLAWRTEVHAKMPGSEGTDWHQAISMTDETGRPFLVWDKETPPNALGGCIVVWTAFTDITLQNSCMQFIPGTHTKAFYDELKVRNARPETIDKTVKDGVLRGFFGYDWRKAQVDPDWRPDQEDHVSMTMKAGQFVVFWSTVVHASLPNVTNRPRYATNVRYVPTSVAVYPGVDRIEEAYTSAFALDNYAAVLVSGEDSFKLNKTVEINRRGFRFPKLP